MYCFQCERVRNGLWLRETEPRVYSNIATASYRKVLRCRTGHNIQYLGTLDTSVGIATIVMVGRPKNRG
jgi:hypothetical protein